VLEIEIDWAREHEVEREGEVTEREPGHKKRDLSRFVEICY